MSDSAFPHDLWMPGENFMPDNAKKSTGLTKRELFAAMAMQGIWANPHDIPAKRPDGTAFDKIADVAVKQADALIKALAATPEAGDEK